MNTLTKKCTSRDLVIKTNLNADEFLAFKHKCEAAGVAVATRIRVLINRDADATNRINSDRRREWPKVGRVRAVFPPAHGRFGAPVPRLRL